MKKVKYSKEQKERKTKKKFFKKELIWGIFIIAIMVSSIMGFIYSGGGGSADYTYNEEFKFTKTEQNTFIYMNVEKQVFSFRYLPYEVDHLNISNKIVPPQIYMIFDPEADNIEAIELMRYELVEDLSKLDIFVSQGVTSENSIYSLPVMDCESANTIAPILYFKSSNETTITENDNCVMLQARSAVDFVMIKERVLYNALGIIE